ncbi:hypothetical protein Tco_0481590 [Tanacetum coccineum]
MDDPNMTMEEYIKFEEEKARRHGRVFDWKTATYGKIRVDDDLYDLRSMEAEFPAIIVDDAFEPQDALQCKSQIRPLLPREQRNTFKYLRYEGLEYTDSDIANFESRLERIYTREIHKVQVVDFQGMSKLLRDSLFARMVMEHCDEVGVVVFTSQDWGRLFGTRGPLVWELIWSSLARSDLVRIIGQEESRAVMRSKKHNKKIKG